MPRCLPSNNLTREAGRQDVHEQRHDGSEDEGTESSTDSKLEVLSGLAKLRRAVENMKKKEQKKRGA